MWSKIAFLKNVDSHPVATRDPDGDFVKLKAVVENHEIGNRFANKEVFNEGLPSLRAIDKADRPSRLAPIKNVAAVEIDLENIGAGFLQSFSQMAEKRAEWSLEQQKSTGLDPLVQFGQEAAAQAFLDNAHQSRTKNMPLLRARPIMRRCVREIEAFFGALFSEPMSAATSSGQHGQR